jgi:hypothetical protein
MLIPYAFIMRGPGNLTLALMGAVMPPGHGRLGLGRIVLIPLDLTRVDFSALESDEDVLATAQELVRDQLVRTGEAEARRAWEEFLDRLGRLPGLKGAVLKPSRSEGETRGYMEEAGRDLERDIVGEPRRALEARAVRELLEARAVRGLRQARTIRGPVRHVR